MTGPKGSSSSSIFCVVKHPLKSPCLALFPQAKPHLHDSHLC